MVRTGTDGSDKPSFCFEGTAWLSLLDSLPSSRPHLPIFLIAVLEVPIDGASTTKTRSEIGPARSVSEVLKLVHRLGIAGVSPADVLQVHPYLDVMYTAELTPPTIMRAKVRACQPPAGRSPGNA